MDDAVAVALVMRTPYGWRFRMFAPAGVAAELGAGREHLALNLFQFLAGTRHGSIW